MTGSAPEWEEANRFFNNLWSKGDPWELETSAFERAKYDAQLSLLEGRRYGRTLEIGCAAGVFTNRLARHCEEVIAVDASSVAIERAQKISAAPNIDYQVGNIMDWKDSLDRDWDLVVCAETLCYLGWLYPFFDVAWIAHQLYQGTRPGGRLLLASTCGGTSDYLLLPFVIRSYHDLFRNVGYRTLEEQTFRGVKNGVEIEALITLAERPA